MLTIPLLPDAAPSHGALDSGPGPLGDTMTSSRGGSSSRPRIATLSRVTRRASVERLVQATTVRRAAPLTFASGSESCPKPLVPKFVGFAPQVFRVRASDHLSSPSDDRANSGVRHAASATRTAACATQPAQRERRRAPRSQRNANGGVPTQPAQRERRRRHAASATRTAACAMQPAQREWRRAPRSQRNANGGERRAANATRTAAGTVAPALSHSRCSTHLGDPRPAREQRAEPRALMSFGLRWLFLLLHVLYIL
ncbi:hypothetical protein BC826DRAFT_1108080 [Russula brevipes]|nr:hypothetical protein BC826DRAFT_1108080 [Russula brevipes]